MIAKDQVIVQSLRQPLLFWLPMCANYIDAGMVKSFIASPEYPQRFGQP